MKSKRKFDSKAIKQFFIDHTEKIVIGVVGLVFLYFTYGAMMLQVNDSYKKEPKDLNDATTAAQNAMKIGPRNKTPEIEEPISPYGPIIEQFKKPIPDKYVMVNALDINVIPPPRLRGIPAVVPIEELRAVAGRGALGSREGAATVGQRWIAVTGLVPYAKQLAAYKLAFQEAGTLGEHDIPEYAGFLIQRVEVQPGAAAEPNWNNAATIFVGSDFLTGQMSRWNGGAVEVVDPKYVQPSLTSPLPPLAIGDWGDDVAHPAQIKVIPLEEREQGMAAGQGVGPLPEREPVVGNRRIREGVPMPPRRGDGGNPRAGRQPVGPPMPGQRGVLGRRKVQGNDVAADNANVAQAPDYYLLRYFDFDVEPGKQYAYRVLPILMNPNYNLEDSVLADSTQSKLDYLRFDPGTNEPDQDGKIVGWKIIGQDNGQDLWTPSPSPTARVSGDVRMLAGAVEPPKTPAPTESTAEIRLLIWDKETGINMNAHLNGILRGMVPDFQKLNPTPPGQDHTTRESAEPPPITPVVLVDIAGGEALTRGDRGQIHRGGIILLLDDSGTLVLHDEMGETKEWIAETTLPDRMNAGGRTPEGRRGGRFDQGPMGKPRYPRGESLLPEMTPGGRVGKPR